MVYIPNPFESEETEPKDCRHSYVAGMLYVHDEDLDTIAETRKAKGLSPIECEKCDKVYDPDEEYENAMEADPDNMGF